MSSAPSVGEASGLTLAEEAHRLVQVDPRRAETLARQALAQATAADDARAEIAARYALGWALHALGETAGGNTTLRAGIRLARRTGDNRGEGLLRRRLAFQLAFDGHRRAAQRELEGALALLTGPDRAQSQVHRIEIHRKANPADPQAHRRVYADAARALRRLRRDRDEIWEARLLLNRGLLHRDRGDFERAEADLRHAQNLY